MELINIECNPNYSYSDIIKIFNTELETPVIPHTNLAETILDILMGTRQIREGSKPNLEYQYRVLQIIKRSIEESHRLSVVIPAGPKKPGLNGNYIDLAEFWFLKILGSLGEKITAIYPYGIRFNIILEDASMELFEPEMPIGLATDYRNKMISLAYTLGYQDYIAVIGESDLTHPDDLLKVGHEIYPAIKGYIDHMLEPNPDLERAKTDMGHMQHLGWQGSISMETLNWYLDNFKKNYPEKSRHEIISAIALYLATSYARYKLNTRRLTNHDIIAANAKKVPGVEFKGYDRIFYRTVPLEKTKTNIPFWRARGIIKIEGGEYATKLIPYGMPIAAEETTATIKENGSQSEIRIDIWEE